MKKGIWGLIIILMVGIIAWFDIPYLITTDNIISKQHIADTYEKISIYNWYSMDSLNIEVTNEEKIKTVIDKIDELKLRRTKILAYGNESITFMASYKDSKGDTCIGDVFTIELTKVDKDNILTLNRNGYNKSYSYKIMDKAFDCEVFINQLKALAKDN